MKPIRKSRLAVAIALGFLVAGLSLPANAHCTRRSLSIILVASTPVTGVGYDVDKGACPAAGPQQTHVIPPGVNAIAIRYIYPTIIIGTPPSGYVKFSGLGGDRVVPIPFSFAGNTPDGRQRLDSWPIPIHPLEKGKATAVVTHGTVIRTVSLRTVGT